MNPEEYELVSDTKHGYRRLDPIPSDAELSEFYQSEYPELLAEGELADDVSRLLEGGAAAEQERVWRRSTWYTDYLHIVEQYSPDFHRVLDVGCGTGEFISFADDQGYDTIGIEPSGRIAKAAREKGLTIRETTVETFAQSHDSEFDLVTMFNVLEHVPNPVEVLRACRSLLSSGGVLAVKVPNEFNAFQLAAQDSLGLDRWWVQAPTHIFYFDYESMGSLLSDLEFDVRESLADFPMSLFLLMGENYVKDDAVGSECHERRVRFERSISDEDRRSFYMHLAQAGLGRNCTLLATVE